MEYSLVSIFFPNSLFEVVFIISFFFYSTIFIVFYVLTLLAIIFIIEFFPEFSIVTKEIFSIG
jgi:hypothetical protein